MVVRGDGSHLHCALPGQFYGVHAFDRGGAMAANAAALLQYVDDVVRAGRRDRRAGGDAAPGRTLAAGLAGHAARIHGAVPRAGRVLRAAIAVSSGGTGLLEDLKTLNHQEHEAGTKNRQEI